MIDSETTKVLLIGGAALGAAAFAIAASKLLLPSKKEIAEREKVKKALIAEIEKNIADMESKVKSPVNPDKSVYIKQDQPSVSQPKSPQ